MTTVPIHQTFDAIGKTPVISVERCSLHYPAYAAGHLGGQSDWAEPDLVPARCTLPAGAHTVSGLHLASEPFKEIGLGVTCSQYDWPAEILPISCAISQAWVAKAGPSARNIAESPSHCSTEHCEGLVR